jgi:hypothetical protein
LATSVSQKTLEEGAKTLLGSAAASYLNSTAVAGSVDSQIRSLAPVVDWPDVLVHAE